MSSTSSLKTTTTTTATDYTTTSESPLHDKPEKKKSLYQRYQEYRRGLNNHISDEDMVKYTGKTKAEVVEWSKTQPGVAGNRPARGITRGSIFRGAVDGGGDGGGDGDC